MTVPLLIAGKKRQTREKNQILNPFNGETVDEVCIASELDVDEAIGAADSAFQSMKTLSAHQRHQILTQVAKDLAEQKTDFANLMVAESGKPITAAIAEVERAIQTIKLGASEVFRPLGEVLPADADPRGIHRTAYYVRVPRGPLAAISPFNFPLNLVLHKLSPAVAVGTSTVLKPAHQCPLTALKLGDLFTNAGLPPGGLNIVHCPPAIAQRLVEDDRMKVLSFTGSDQVGWKLKSLAGRKQVMLELGGNAPCIVDDDANLDQIMPQILTGAWSQSGQVCIKIQNIFVHRRIYSDFLNAFVSASGKIRCGDPQLAETVVGPLIDRNQVHRVMDWVREAKQEGAKIHCGGESHGNVVLPTVISEAGPHLRVRADEVFGPVTVVTPFADFDEAINLCNSSRFGLQAGVFTNRISHMQKAFHQINYGGILINDTPTFRLDNLPYGGIKDSGFGREGVQFAAAEMTELKTMFWRGI